MEFDHVQTAEPSTSSLMDEIVFDEKHSITVLKTENEKVVKQKVNEDLYSFISGEIYEECDQLIEQKINLIEDLKVKHQMIYQAEQNKSEIQSKLDGDKAILRTNVIKCKEHFSRLKNIVVQLTSNEDVEKKNHQIKEEIDNYKLKEEASNEYYSDKINDSLQSINVQNLRYMRSVRNKKTHLKEMNEQQIHLYDQFKIMRETLNENDNKQQLFKQEQKHALNDLNDLKSEYAKLKEKHSAYVQKNEPEKLRRDTRIQELKATVQSYEEKILIVTSENEKLHAQFDNGNMRLTEVQNKHSSLVTSFMEVEERLAVVQEERSKYQRQLQQQREILRDKHSSELDNVQVLKDQFELLNDKNVDLKQNCAHNEDIIATLTTGIRDTLENIASTEYNVLHNEQEIQEKQKSYEDIISRYTTKTSELRVENEKLVNTRAKLKSAIESRKQEYEQYKNDMEAKINKYSESEQNDKTAIKNLNLKIERLKKNSEESSEEMRNMKLEVEEKYKIMEKDSGKKIKELLKGYEEMKKKAEDVARKENTRYQNNKRTLNERTEKKNNQIQELKRTKLQLQNELDQYISEISKLSADCEKYEKRNSKPCDPKFSSTLDIAGIEKINKLDPPKISIRPPSERVQQLAESSDDSFHYTSQARDIDKEWQKLKSIENINKVSQSVKSTIPAKKSSKKYEMSFKETDSDTSETSKNESGELFVPRWGSGIFKQPAIRRPVRRSKRSKTYNVN